MKTLNENKLYKIANNASNYLYVRLNKGLTMYEIMGHKKMIIYRMQFEKEAERIKSNKTLGDMLS